MTCWEYKTVSRYSLMKDAELADLGDDGWLLCSELVTPNMDWVYRFARPKAGGAGVQPGGEEMRLGEAVAPVALTPGHCGGTQ